MNAVTIATIKSYVGRTHEALLSYEPQGYDLMRARKVGMVNMVDPG